VVLLDRMYHWLESNPILCSQNALHYGRFNWGSAWISIDSPSMISPGRKKTRLSVRGNRQSRFKTYPLDDVKYVGNVSVGRQ